MTGRRAAVLLALALTAPISHAAVASAQEPGDGDGCVEWDAAGQCAKEIAVPVGVPQVPAPDDDPEPATGAPAPLPNCRWRTIPTIPGIEAWIGPPTAGMENPVLQGYQCDENDGVPGSSIGLPISFRWVEGGSEAPTAMTAEMLAQLLYVRVRAQMQAPEVASDPPASSPAVVKVPVFVEVANWQPPIVETECDPVGGLCVTMTATPALSWAPGEPGAPVVPCEPSGTRFDPAGGPAELQAVRPGACAWTFQQRTGAEGRPDAWSGEVTVDWAVTWAASNGSDGAFPGLSFSSAVPRAVEEVQTVVADDE